MKTSDLKNINALTRKLILDYLSKSGMTLNAFAKESGVHQNQLWLYLHSGDPKKGLHSTTMEKIGKYLHENTKK
jgi:DNA transposition AAA+ family ATPase